jgi:serine/threonine protein kinase
MKQLKGDYSSGWEDFTSYRELQSLMCMRQHPNIVRIHEVHLTIDTSSLFFVFEYMNRGSLYDLILDKQRQQQQQHQLCQTTIVNHNMLLLLPENDIRSILRQALQGLSHMHKEGYMHRDMKPENILLHDGGVCKVADFSLARKYNHDSLSCHDSSYSTTTTACWQNHHDPLTGYVSTRWYRAPEIMLCMPDYGPAVDVYAMACIAAECFMGRALFPGNSEIDQLHCIFQLLGAPTRQSWEQGWEHLEALPFSVSPSLQSTPSPTTPPSPPPASSNVITLSGWSPTPSHVSTASSANYHSNTCRILQQVVPMASRQAIDLIARLLRLDPNKRLTCDEALKHGYLRQEASASPSSSLMSPSTPQLPYSLLATVPEDTSSVGESSAHVSPMTESPAAGTVAVPPLLHISRQKVAGVVTAPSTAATTAATTDQHNMDNSRMLLPAITNTSSTEDADDESMRSRHSFSSRSTSSTSSTSSSSMSSDSCDGDSSDDESIMSTQST